MLGLSSPLISLAIQASAVTFAVVSLFPKAAPVVDVRYFNEGHKINMELSKPALAALADTYYEYDPVQNSGAIPTLAVESIQLEPVVLDVSDIVAAEGSQILEQEHTQAVVQATPPSESVGFSRRGVVALPEQVQSINAFLKANPPSSKKFEGLKATTKSLSETLRPQPIPKATEPDPVVKTFETVHGFRDYAREISGKIEFKPGLALTSSNDQLVVYRQVRGERADYGHVFYDRGEFAIYVSELRGDLVGELRNLKGQVLGRGMLSLDKIFTDRRQVTNLSLFLEPARTGFGGQVFDLAEMLKSGRVSPLQGARIDYLGFADFIRTMPDGSFLDVDVVSGSQTLIQVTSDGYLPTMAYLQEGVHLNIPLVKEQVLEELFPTAALARQKNVGLDGFVIGKILADGAPKSGAQVTLLEGLKMKPVYLDDKGRPARRQGRTDASGLFLIPNIPPGLAAVRVSVNGSESESKVIPVGEATVTYLEIDMKRTIDVQVNYRSFPGSAVTPMVTRTLASEDMVEPEHKVAGNLRVAPGPDPLFIVADGGDEFEPMTYTALRESSNLELPVLKKDWVDSLYNKIGKSKLEFAGQILGWIGARSSFVVEIDQLDDEMPTAEVLYLDHKGEVLHGAQEGVVGGSYIILNAGEGLRRVRVYYSSGEYSSCLAYLEAGTTAACAY
jgi:hypothetical protein